MVIVIITNAWNGDSEMTDICKFVGTNLQIFILVSNFSFTSYLLTIIENTRIPPNN